ncbi:hypothetical protein PM082_024451 [Marasmius tenuissimus]|nr:hypothetical protein PM082_024451 [Marasmius tenuissimus]
MSVLDDAVLVSESVCSKEFLQLTYTLLVDPVQTTILADFTELIFSQGPDGTIALGYGQHKSYTEYPKNRPIRRLYPSLRFISLDSCSLPPASCHPKSTWNTTCHLQIKHQYRWKHSI